MNYTMKRNGLDTDREVKSCIRVHDLLISQRISRICPGILVLLFSVPGLMATPVFTIVRLGDHALVMTPTPRCQTFR